MSASDSLSAEDAEAAFRQLQSDMDRLMESGQTTHQWPIEAGSPLAGDDRASRPFQVSHAASASLGAALDHLHALTTLVVGTRTIHARAPYALARAAIENAATALWLVEPQTRSERVLRTLRLHAADARDGAKASGDLHTLQIIPLQDRLAELRALAAAVGGSLDDGPRTTVTDIVKAADSLLDTDFSAGPLGAWRVFSGFSHGRPWALAAFSDQEREAIGNGLVQVTSRSSLNRVLYAASIAADVFNLAAETYMRRASAPRIG